MTANATLINIATDSGWFAERGYHSYTNRNAFTGQVTSTLFGNAPEDTDKYNSFMIFNIPFVSGEITSIGLNVYFRDVVGLAPEDDFEFSIYNVSTIPTEFNSNHDVGSETGLAIFNDLQSGETYGSFNVKPWYLNEYLGLSLSESAAMMANNSQGQLFVLGISITSDFRTLDGPEGVNFGVTAYTQDLLTELVIGVNGEDISSYLDPVPTPVPVPASVIFFGTGIAGFVGLRFRRKKK